MFDLIKGCSFTGRAVGNEGSCDSRTGSTGEALHGDRRGSGPLEHQSGNKWGRRRQKLFHCTLKQQEKYLSKKHSEPSLRLSESKKIVYLFIAVHEAQMIILQTEKSQNNQQLLL